MLPLLQIKNLTVEFPGTASAEPALHHIDLELNRGEMLAVVGESGSGKSVMSLSLMNLLSKSARVVEGSILFSSDGKNAIDLLTLPEKKFRSYRGNQLAMIFQEPMTSLNPVMSCGAQLREPLMLHKKLSRKQARAAALSLFEKVQLTEPERIFNKYPHQLSGGQKQRVMIAMAISCNPSLLICDEPTTALDVRVQKTILDLLQNLRRSENMGMIFITHDLGIVADMADRAMVMLRGRVVESGLVKSVFSNPQHPYTRGLLLCRPSLHIKGERLPVVSDFMEELDQLSDEIKTDPEFKLNHGEYKIQPAVHKLNSPEFISNPPKLKADLYHENEREVLLKVKGLKVCYGSGKNWFGREKKVDILRDIDFEVFRGETLGLVGESGSGKTTLGRALLGLNRPAAGSISFGGNDILAMRKKDLLGFRKNIQIVFQDPYSSLNPRLMIGPAIAEPIKVHRISGRSSRKELVLELLGKVDLKAEYYNRYPHAFSGGQRQRIVIARALALNPGFVVFDESVSALDVSVQAQILNLINDLKKKLGFTAIFISHDLSVIRYLCDRVMVMEKGRIIESGNAEEVYRHPKTVYTRSLIEAIPGLHL